MNRATLAELQHQRSYPSITLLFNTTPGMTLSPDESGSRSSPSICSQRRTDSSYRRAWKLAQAREPKKFGDGSSSTARRASSMASS